MSEVKKEETAAVKPVNFIRTIIEQDLAQGNNLPRYWCGHPAPYSVQLAQGKPDTARIRTPAGTERVSAYRARQVHLSEFRPRA